MKYLDRLMKTEKRHEMFIAIVLVVYIVFNIRLPSSLASLVDNILGKIVVFVLILSVFMSTNPILGVLSLIAGYELIRRSSVQTGSNALLNMPSSENAKNRDYLRFNDFPATLEEECVKKMPETRSQYVVPEAGFEPIQDDDLNAAPVDYSGVI